jgi:sialate O-acetylesterase
MMVQADCPVYLEGTATPGDTIRVELNRFVRTVRADAQGDWQVNFPPLSAGTSFAVLITTTTDTVRIHNALAGELWLCSGQSNMARTVSLTDVKDSIEGKDLTTIRYFRLADNPQASPQVMIRGKWLICTPEHTELCSAVGLSMAYHLSGVLKRPIGLVITAQGGTPIGSWTSPSVLQKKKYDQYIFARQEKWRKARPAFQQAYQAQLSEWKKRAREAHVKGENPPPRIYPPFALRENWAPGSLYYGLVFPFRHVPFRGVLWYQGESNDTHPFVYRYQLADLIHCWRETFQNPSLPFYIIQLPGYGSPEDWPVLRESQHWSTRLDGVHLVVTIDLGDSLQIHPIRKMQVGWRSALQILRHSYALKLTATGPEPVNWQFGKGQAFVEFDQPLKVSEPALPDIEIAGSDHKYRPAYSRVEGSRLVVWNPDVPVPLNVRYAWKSFPPHANLFNLEELPVAPFMLSSPSQK